MPKEVSLDYLGYLDQKWRDHLKRKYNPWSPEKRRVQEDLTDMLDEMKNQTKVGIMLYNCLYDMYSKPAAKEERNAFETYLRRQK